MFVNQYTDYKEPINFVDQLTCLNIDLGKEDIKVVGLV